MAGCSAAGASRAHQRSSAVHSGGIPRDRGVALSGRSLPGRDRHRNQSAVRHSEVAALSRVEPARVAAGRTIEMTRGTHEQARELISFGKDRTGTQQTWLRTHLEQCAACRQFAEVASEIVRSVQSLPLAADARLVRATQMRVRFHASRLQETREREWLVGLACLGVGLSATLTLPFLWRLFAWMGEW